MPKPLKKNQRSRIGFDLAVETIERRAHRLFGEVLPDVDLESLSPQVIGQCAGTVDRILQRRIGVRIGRVGDDQRHPCIALLR